MLILNAAEVRKALPMAQTIETMKEAYAAFSDGRAEVPLRTRLPIDSQNAVSIFMPALVRETSSETLAIKVVSVFPENVVLGLPIIHAAVIVLDANSGRILALLEGGTLTAI
ncbi:MAG: ornithine cyclodeaminase family protein, partial [Chloroflexota bacterium]